MESLYLYSTVMFPYFITCKWAIACVHRHCYNSRTSNQEALVCTYFSSPLLRHTGYNDLSERPPPPSSSHSQLAGLPGVIRSGSGDPAGISGVGVVSGGVGVVSGGGGGVSSQPNPQTSSRARDRVRYIRLERALN